VAAILSFRLLIQRFVSAISGGTADRKRAGVTRRLNCGKMFKASLCARFPFLRPSAAFDSRNQAQPRLSVVSSEGGKAVIAMLQRPGKSDRVHTPTKLAKIIDTVVAEGVSPAQALAGVGVSPAELLSPDTRVSLQQVLIACANAIRLSRDSSLAFRAGASMHISSFGMYGFAILCSADFRKTMSFCERYHVLSTPLVTLTFREEHGEGVWSVDPIVQTPINDPLYRFIVEMQMGIILSLMRDVMGASFSPKEVALAFSRPNDFGLATAPADGIRAGEQQVQHRHEVALAGTERAMQIRLPFNLDALVQVGAYDPATAFSTTIGSWPRWASRSSHRIRPTVIEPFDPDQIGILN
jgi:hypothetical protein